MVGLTAASVGALPAFFLTHADLSIIAIIGIILLIGIVKKNAIMMIAFALAAERNEGQNLHGSIVEACTLRFRPILMTATAAHLEPCCSRWEVVLGPNCVVRSASRSSGG